MDAALRLFALACVACSVPPLSLDGKLCPCAEGYTCDTATNLCRPKVTGDGGFTGCLSGTPGTSISSGFATFASGVGSWNITSTQVAQPGPAALAFAYANDTSLDRSMYRVVAHMTSSATAGRMGIAVRVSANLKQRYECVWDLGGSSTLYWRSINNSMATTIPPTAPRPTSIADVTMEVLANGGTLTCCLDEVSASVSITNATTPASGLPGVVADDIVATFDQFTVFTN